MKSVFKKYGVSPKGLVFLADQSDPRSYGNTQYWKDLSGNANDMQQDTAGSQPAIGGVQGLAGSARTFDGTADYMQQKVYANKVGAVTMATVASGAMLIDAGQDFRPYAGATGNTPYMVVATDTSVPAKTAWGYLGEEGTGETLGADLFDAGAGTFDSGTYSWAPYASNIITNDAGALKIQYVDSSYGASTYLNDSYDLTTNLTVGALYKLSFDAKVNTGAVAVRLYLGESKNIATITETSFVSKEAYFTSHSETGVQFHMYGMSAGEIIWLDNIVLTKVLTPPATTGVKIYSQKNGSTQSWANVETGFLPNSVASYEIRKSDFQITGAMTVGAWVKADTQGGTSGIISKYDALANKRSFTLASQTTTNKFRMLLSSNGTIKKDYYSDGVAFDNTWHFICFTYDGNNNLELYLDGVVESSPTKTTDLSMTSVYDSDIQFHVGSYFANGVEDNFFLGSIQKPFIYDRALSAGEVAAFYNATRRMYGMFVVNDDGRSMKYWKDGMPFVFIGTNDSGSMKYWSGGVPAVVIS